MASDLTETTASRSLTLEEKISSVTELLQPVSADLVAATLLRMQNAGLDYAGGMDPRGAKDFYVFAMRGVCREGFKRAATRIMQGTAPEVSGFIPKPPAFAALARSESAELWRERDRLMLTAESLSLGKDREPKSEEAKAKVGKDKGKDGKKGSSETHEPTLAERAKAVGLDDIAGLSDDEVHVLAGYVHHLSHRDDTTSR